MNILSKHTACAALLIFGALLTGCRQQGALAKPWQMGEKVQVGTFIYTVLEADWKTELHGNLGSILPKNRFLVLRISVTNAGGEDRSLAFLQLKDEKGGEYTEFSELEGVSGWLGILRKLPPAGNEQGLIVYDVPPSSYKLVATDNANPGEEKTTMIDIPLVMKPESGASDAPITGR